MSEMIERAVDAIEKLGSVDIANYQHREMVARAVIEAMREPTTKMFYAVAADWGGRTWRQYRQVIDAALSQANSTATNSQEQKP